MWDVTTSEEGDTGARYQLTRRVGGPIVDAIQELGSVSERAGHHLKEAWTQLLGSDPDPSAAYQAAVQAVEVAAKPVVSPNNAGATLGTMRGQLRADQRDHPGRWEFELGDFQVVLDMISALWESQLRHGNESAPTSETQEEADRQCSWRSHLSAGSPPARSESHTRKLREQARVGHLPSRLLSRGWDSPPSGNQA